MSLNYAFNLRLCFILQELLEFYIDLLSEIFGYGEYNGWRLNTLHAKSHSDEALYKKVYNFLHPFGHVFKLIKKLENENAVIDLPSNFSVSFLIPNYLI